MSRAAPKFADGHTDPRTLMFRWLDAELKRQERRARHRAALNGARFDLLNWGRRYLAEHFALPPSALHRWLAARCDEMAAARGIKINVLGPRGGAKSTIGSLALPLCAALERWETYIWIVSDTRHQACAHLENIKSELLDNRRLAADYPDAVGRGPVWRSGAITLRNGVTIEAFGTGQRIRGRRRRAARPTLVICDDLQNDGHMQSIVQRDRSRTWFHGTLMKAGTARTNFLNLATALHRDALAMELCRNPGWDARVFQAITSWPERMDLWHAWETLYRDVQSGDAKQAAREFFETHRQEMEAGAEVLWPEQEDLYTLMCMRAEEGRAAFEREKQNSPISPELCEWPEEYFEPGIWFDHWPAEARVKVMTLDPSKGSDARRGDYSAYVMLAVDRQGTLYVEADLARRPTPQIVVEGVELYRRFQPDALGVETNQFQQLLADEMDAEFARQGLLAARPWPMENRVAKAVRIRRLGPYLASRRLRFKADSPGTQLLVDQLKMFPVGDHDDGPDALEMAVRLAGEYLAAPHAPDGLGDRLPLEV
jgi:predicted phage terminase large subunit-like protein